MPDLDRDTFDQLPLAAKQHIDLLCANFENGWKNGTLSRLENVLAEAPEDERPALLAELLHIDIAWRKRRGESPRADDYSQLLPAYEAIVRRVLDEFDPKTETDFSENAGHAAKRRQLGDGQSKEAETVIPGAKGHRPAESLPIIPGYDVDGLLGRGGMGVVYDARQKSLGRRVAIKMVLAGELATAEDHTRFLAEAATIAHLRHPNIVQIFEVGEYQGRLFFALEHLEGGSLRQKLRGEPMPPKPAAALIEKLAHAVDYAHQQGIVHRDLTPGNILLASDGEPKITDFGLAKHLSSAANLTATGAVMGTPQYMSPEQARGDTKSVGPAADIYALGAILYEALTGRPPFIGGNAMEVIVQVTGDEPMPVTRLNRGVPQDLGTLCMKCLEKPQARRYATAAALAEDLRRFQDGEPISARRVSEWERAWKWARRRPLVAASLAIAVVALIAGTIISTIFAFEADERRSDAVARRNEAVIAAKEARKQQSQTQRREALLLFQNAVTMAEAKGQITPALHMMLAAAQAAPPDDVAFDRVVRANLAAWLPQAAELRMILPPAPRGLSHWGISPDSRWLLSAENADSGRLRIWDAATGELRYTLAGPSPTIEPKRRCAFHPNGQWLAVALTLRGGREADTLRVYDLATGKPRGADLNAS